MLLLCSLQVLVLGSIYTLSRKFQNLQLSVGLGEKALHFHHPLYAKDMLNNINELKYN